MCARLGVETRVWKCADRSQVPGPLASSCELDLSEQPFTGPDGCRFSYNPPSTSTETLPLTDWIPREIPRSRQRSPPTARWTPMPCRPPSSTYSALPMRRPTGCRRELTLPTCATTEPAALSSMS